MKYNIVSSIIEEWREIFYFNYMKDNIRTSIILFLLKNKGQYS